MWLPWADRFVWRGCHVVAQAADYRAGGARRAGCVKTQTPAQPILRIKHHHHHPPTAQTPQTYPTAPGVPVTGASWFSHWGVKKTPSAGLRQVAMLVSVTHLWEFAPAFGREKGDWHGHLCRTSHLLGDARQRWGGGGNGRIGGGVWLAPIRAVALFTAS